MIRIIKLVTCFTFILISGACNRNIAPSENIQRPLYPPPPDRGRIQYLTSFSDSEDVGSERSKFSEFIMGPADIMQISKPYGIASTKDEIYICDPPEGVLEIINLKNKTFRYFQPIGQGSLKQPLNCTIDKDGNIYIADIATKKVVIFNKHEEFIGNISGSQEFRPTDVAVSDNFIYVTDPDNNKVNIYNKQNLDLVRSLTEFATIEDDDWLFNPMNIYISESEGYLYIADFGHSKVKKFSLQGEYISSVGGYGRNLGQFTRLKGIAIDREENLFAVDAAFSNIQIFNKQGQLLLFFGGAYSDKPGDMYMPSNVTIDYDNLEYFQDLVHPEYVLKYLILVTNQFGPDKVSVYGRIDPK